MTQCPILSQTIAVLPALKDFHTPTCEPFNLLRMVARKEVESFFLLKKQNPVPLRHLESWSFPTLGWVRLTRSTFLASTNW